MKKTILAIVVSSLTIMSNAGGFQVVIDKTKAAYESDIVNWIDNGINYTNWIDVGVEFNCGIWIPESTNQLSSYNQTSTCDQNQERKKQYMEKDLFSGNTRVIKEEKESQIIQKSTNRNIVVNSESPIQQGSSFDCNTWTPLSSESYYGTNVDQNRICSANMIQDYVHILDSSEIHRHTNNYIDTQKDEYKTVAGTKKHTIFSKSCGYDGKLSGQCSGSRIDTTYYSSGTGRGWAILVLNPNDFSAKNYNRFDTHGDPDLSNSMATMINNIASGDLVIISTYDQPAYINSAFVNAMGTHLKANTTFLNEISTLGYPNSDDRRYRSSYSLISYKGGQKIAEDYGYRHDDSEVSALLPK